MTALHNGAKSSQGFWYQCDGPTCDKVANLGSDDYDRWHELGDGDDDPDYCSMGCQIAAAADKAAKAAASLGEKFRAASLGEKFRTITGSITINSADPELWKALGFDHDPNDR